MHTIESFQLITAAKTVASHPNSKIAQENMEAFADMFQWLVSDVTAIIKEVIEAIQKRPEKQVYMSLPRPGVGFIKSVFRQAYFNEFIVEAWHNIQATETSTVKCGGAREDCQIRP